MEKDDVVKIAKKAKDDFLLKQLKEDQDFYQNKYNKTIDKLYTPLFARSHTTQTEYVETTQPIGGLNVLLDTGFNYITLNEIKELLKILTSQMYSSGGISKKEILVSLKKYDIDFLYLVDLTCSVYSNIIPSKDPDGNDVFRREQLLDPRLTSAYEKKKLRGGKENKKNKKSKKYQKYQKKRKYNKQSIRNRNRNNH